MKLHYRHNVQIYETVIRVTERQTSNGGIL